MADEPHTGIDIPEELGRILQAAGARLDDESVPPDEVGGRLIGALGYLAAGVSWADPEWWPTWRYQCLAALDDLRKLILSEDPMVALEVLRRKQQRQYEERRAREARERG